MDGLGKILMGAGVALFLVGLLIVLANRFGIQLGRLPGDISVHRTGFSFYFPLATCVVISLVATLVFWLIGVLKR